MKLIHPLIIIRILSVILLIGTLSFVLCSIVAFLYSEPLYPFLYSILITGVIAVLLRYLSRNVNSNDMGMRDGYLVVTLSWFIVSIYGTLPYMISGAIPCFFDAFFETASGFTTAGASILTEIEGLPKSILFWRCLTHWIGGLGIIMLVIIILPALKIPVHQIMTLESTVKEKISPKTKSIGLRLLSIYVSLTVAETLFLWYGEMDLFDSLCHSFSTIATGGFSNYNDSLVGCSVYTQIVVTVFMFFAGVNFVLYYYILKRKFVKVVKNEELWFYAFIVFIFSIVIALVLVFDDGYSVSSSLRMSFFQVISIISSTGFATADYNLWPGLCVVLMFLLLFAGACSGSTSGGPKMFRYLVALKNIRNVFTKLHHPNVITQVKLNGNPLPDKSDISIMAFLILYFFVFIIGSFIVILTGVEPLAAISSTIASLGCVGPALGSLGPMANYACIPDITKMVLAVLMIVGRLELMTVFVIFTRSFWKL